MVVAMGAAAVALINGCFQLVSTRRSNRRDEQSERRDRILSGEISVIKNEVKNHHPTNLRDDLTSVATAVNQLSENLRDVAHDVREVRKHSGKLFELDRRKEYRLTKLEKKYIENHPENPVKY